MSPREAFKVGFMLRCAEEGLDEEAIRRRVEKAADLKTVKDVLGTAGEVLGGGLSALKGTAQLGFGTAAATGIGTGLLGGYGLARMTDPGFTPEGIKRQELIATYETLADELEERRRAEREGAVL